MQKKQKNNQAAIAEIRTIIILEAILLFAFSFSLIKTPQSFLALLLSLALLILLTVPLLLAANAQFVKKLQRNENKYALVVAGIALLQISGCIAYAVLTGQRVAEGILTTAIWIVLLVFTFFILRKRRYWLLDAALVLILWAGAYILDQHVLLPPADPFAQPFMLITTMVFMYIFFVSRGEKMGYTFKLKGDDIQIVILNVLLFFFIGVIISILIGSLTVADRAPGLMNLLITFVRLFFLSAIPEEILFRGIIYRLLLGKLRGRKYAVGMSLFMSALLFALFQANGPSGAGPVISLGTSHLPVAKMVLATIAGIFYGLVFIRTKKITASALMHALVAWIWVIFFTS